MRHGLPESVDRKLERRFDPVGRYGIRLTLLGAAVVLVGIPFGMLLEQVLRSGPLTRVDTGVARTLNDHIGSIPGGAGTLQVISFLGKPIWLGLIVGAVVVWALIRRRLRVAVFLVVTCLGGGLVDSLVKQAVGRSRPVVDHPVAHAFGKSFPSGHSMSSTICYGALVLVFLPLLGPVARRVAIGAAAALVLAIGIARMALGLHFLSDVLGGYVLGAAWLMASVAAFEMYRDDLGLRPTAPVTEGVEPEQARELVGAS
ncbi:MAG TPA: phosphatase PAP2 family protein [Acidimicrobiales bacterium]